MLAYLVHIKLVAFIRQRGSVLSHQRGEGETEKFFLPFVLC